MIAHVLQMKAVLSPTQARPGLPATCASPQPEGCSSVSTVWRKHSACLPVLSGQGSGCFCSRGMVPSPRPTVLSGVSRSRRSVSAAEKAVLNLQFPQRTCFPECSFRCVLSALPTLPLRVSVRGSNVTGIHKNKCPKLAKCHVPCSSQLLLSV